MFSEEFFVYLFIYFCFVFYSFLSKSEYSPEVFMLSKWDIVEKVKHLHFSYVHQNINTFSDSSDTPTYFESPYLNSQPSFI